MEMMTRMKYFGILLAGAVAWLGTDGVEAAELSQADAEAIARQYVTLPSANAAMPLRMATSAGTETVPYYVFNDAQGKGFVIIASDDCVEPVIGYADHGSFDERSMPDNMRSWLQSVGEMMEIAKNSASVTATASLSPRRSTTRGTAVAAPLIKTKWDQSAPYNTMLKRPDVLTCCVATAMAQIMNYHQWPVQGSGSSDYISASQLMPPISTETVGRVTVDLNNKYDWDNMLDVYDATVGYTQEQADAVALLMRDCGAAIRVQYGASVSSAYDSDACLALNRNFGYRTAFYQHCDYTTDRFLSIIKGEIDAGRPMLLTGQPTQQGGGGHAFVVDGYDTNDFLHINWGWSGQCDGYYNVCLMDPYPPHTVYPGYQAVSSIIPDRDNTRGDFYRPWVMRFGSSDGKEGIWMNENFSGSDGIVTVNLSGLVMDSFFDWTGSLYLVVVDESGNEVLKLAHVPMSIVADTETGPRMQDPMQLTFPAGVIKDAEIVPDGEYSIKLSSVEEVDGKEGDAVLVSTTGRVNGLKLVKKNGNIEISNVVESAPEVAFVTPVTCPERIAYYEMLNIPVSIKNNSAVTVGGTISASLVPVDGEGKGYDLDSKYVVLYDNRQADFTLSKGLVPSTCPEGEYYLKIKYIDSEDEEIPIVGNDGQTKVTVYYDEAKVPVITASNLVVSDSDGKTYDDLSNIEVTLKDDFELRFSFKYEASGDVWHNVGLRVRADNGYYEREASLSAPKGTLSTTMSDLEMSVGETNILFEYRHPYTWEWTAFAGLPTIHVKISDFSGIADIEAQGATEVARYDTTGRRIERPVKGINIVKMSDGTVRKVIEK